VAHKGSESYIRAKGHAYKFRSSNEDARTSPPTHTNETTNGDDSNPDDANHPRRMNVSSTARLEPLLQ
jgi:hypothetical protein